MSNRSGPVDDTDWPKYFRTRVVEDKGDAAERHLHGYPIERDLARHYTFAETTLIALTGECPNHETGRWFKVALTFIASLSTTHAPVNLGILSRTMGAHPAATTASVCTLLAEEARFTYDSLGTFIELLDQGKLSDSLAEQWQAHSEAERSSVRSLRDMVPLPDTNLSRLCAITAVLHTCGIRTRESFTTVWVMARLPVALAEAWATPLFSIRDYPMDLPNFAYTPKPK